MSNLSSHFARMRLHTHFCLDIRSIVTGIFHGAGAFLECSYKNRGLILLPLNSVLIHGTQSKNTSYDIMISSSRRCK
jgi:hypothetical protein